MDNNTDRRNEQNDTQPDNAGTADSAPADPNAHPGQSERAEPTRTNREKPSAGT